MIYIYIYHFIYIIYIFIKSKKYNIMAINFFDIIILFRDPKIHKFKLFLLGLSKVWDIQVYKKGIY